MAETSIQWCDHSINPLRARNLETGKVGHFCAKVSQGCKNCYSSKLQTPHLVGLPFVAENRPKIELFFEEKAIQEVLRRRKPTKYFWCDMTDMFWEEYPDEWIERCFAAMALTPWHTHLVLTKRGARLMKWSNRQFLAGDVQVKANDLRDRYKIPWPAVLKRECLGEEGHMRDPAELMEVIDCEPWPLPNVWIGVSVEDQAMADERTQYLRSVPAAVRFISQEPQLGNIEWTGDMLNGISWIIIGGESGPNARPFDIDWPRKTITQCQPHGVAVFVKQLGADPREGNSNGNCRNLDCTPPDCGFVRLRLKDKKGGSMEEWPEDLRIRQFPFVQSPDNVVL